MKIWEILSDIIEDYKNNDQLKDIKYLIINSAPPYFVNPTLEEYELMKKYSIYNYGIGYGFLDYDGGCIEHIKGIIRLIKGEYPELPLPVVYVILKKV